MANTIYKVNYTDSSMNKAGNTVLHLTIEGAKKKLADEGYLEISAEDFCDNTCAMWKRDDDFLFAESYAFISTQDVLD